MTRFTRILCPVDFSDHSRRALDHALAIARVHRASLAMVHVVPLFPATAAYAPVPMEPFPVMTPSDREALLESMARLLAEEAGDQAPPCDRYLREGRAVTEILDLAREIKADLIVMGTHGRSGFDRLVLGSVAEKVLRKADCAVMTVPPGAPEAVPAPPVLFREVLCATDFSDCATTALNYALSLTQAAGAALTVVHVIEAPPPVPPDHETMQAGPKNLAEYLAAAEDDARARLEAAIPRESRDTLPVRIAVAYGRPHREILRIANAHQADLIVVGVHGRSAPDMLFFGSTTNHLVREASCPVLTIRRD